MQEEPDSVTMGSVPERRRSLTPEVKRQRGSFDVAADIEMYMTSPTAGVSSDTVEHSTAELLSPSQSSATTLPKITVAPSISSAAESSHTEHDNVHVSESCQCSDTASNKVSATDTETLQSSKKRKKKVSPVVNDDSKDVGHTAVKEHRKHKRKDRVCAPSEKDEAYKPGHVESQMTNKDSVDNMSHSDHEAKQKKSADGAKHKRIIDDVVNSENMNDKANKRTTSDENPASASFGDGRKKTDDSSRKVVRQYRHQDGIRERTCSKTTATHKKHGRKVSVLNSSICHLASILLVKRA